MGTATVLVVDDERKIRDTVRVCLEKQRYAVLVAGSGQEAPDVAGRPNNPAGQRGGDSKGRHTAGLCKPRTLLSTRWRARGGAGRLPDVEARTGRSR